MSTRVDSPTPRVRHLLLGSSHSHSSLSSRFCLSEEAETGMSFEHTTSLNTPSVSAASSHHIKCPTPLLHPLWSRNEKIVNGISIKKIQSFIQSFLYSFNHNVVVVVVVMGCGRGCRCDTDGVSIASRRIRTYSQRVQAISWQLIRLPLRVARPSGGHPHQQQAEQRAHQ